MTTILSPSVASVMGPKKECRVEKEAPPARLVALSTGLEVELLPTVMEALLEAQPVRPAVTMRGLMTSEPEAEPW